MAEDYRPQRKQTPREQALKLFPWICAHCGREFDGKKLSQLTVHHKDHNHQNNPPDGSNWELLCLYCHDNEHQRYQAVDAPGEAIPDPQQNPPSPFTPFARLAALLKRPT
jgi:5-methylcytosine-specific restriction endonuclease McrA